uniref:Uncharacterized protein n=1 Tax=Oryctolagus cuniculus TaxID=9986 RepID=G1U801_RABIT
MFPPASSPITLCTPITFSWGFFWIPGHGPLCPPPPKLPVSALPSPSLPIGFSLPTAEGKVYSSDEEKLEAPAGDPAGSEQEEEGSGGDSEDDAFLDSAAGGPGALLGPKPKLKGSLATGAEEGAPVAAGVTAPGGKSRRRRTAFTSDCRWPGPACSCAEGSRGGSHTVKMLERRLDCLRMGVGVEEAAMVSMRSSRWLMLGVEGTEEE